MNTTIEYCPHCDSEVELEYKFEVQQCPRCKRSIKPCSICTIILDFPNDCKDCPLVKHTLKDNQYLPDGLGKPAKTYYYIVNHLGQTIDYKTLKPYKGKQMKKYAILSLDEAVEILKKINQ